VAGAWDLNSSLKNKISREKKSSSIFSKTHPAPQSLPNERTQRWHSHLEADEAAAIAVDEVVEEAGTVVDVGVSQEVEDEVSFHIFFRAQLRGIETCRWASAVYFVIVMQHTLLRTSVADRGVRRTR
jgi:hypothetical protein